MRKITELIVHCTATPEAKPYTAADIDRWHKAKGWSGIGYHYVITLDGQVQKGRPEASQGAHCLGHNAHSIGICYVGGLAADGHTPKDTRTPEQKAALLRLLKQLKAKYPQATIHAHRDFAAKACPSFDATSEYAYI